MRRTLFFALFLCASLALSLTLTACSESGRADCGTSEDCPDGEICRDGACTIPSPTTCTTAADCPTGAYDCVNGICKQTDATDAGPDTDADPDATDATDTPDTSDDVAEDTDGDSDAPRVVSVEPADGTEDVALDTTVTVTFSEPMDPTTLNYLFIELEAPGNRVVTSTVEARDNNTVAVLTPEAPLHPATPYEVVVSTSIKDEDGTQLEGDFTAMFTTTFSQPDGYDALAETYAPVIYQAMAEPDGRSPKIDIPTTLDFDGNEDGSDNAVNARSGDDVPTANVYYSISETESYYFIHYILYYPARFDSSDSDWSEHDFAGAVFVVDKRNDELLLVEGVKLLDSNDLAIGYKPSGSPTSLLGGTVGNNVSLSSFPDAAIEDGTRYPMYVPSGLHSTCNWVDEGQGTRCVHNSAEFPGGAANGVVMHVGDTAQALADATENTETGFKEMTYKLVPITGTLWPRRSQTGENKLFESPFVYGPSGDSRPEGIDGQGFVLPRRVNATGTDTFGRTPFYWLPSPGASNNGQWMLDPAYVLQNRYSLSDSVEVDYCYNPFFAIDRTSDDACTP
ncbi:MAG: Ig-like domain-containing protein [Myxococcota bacterium]